MANQPAAAKESKAPWPGSHEMPRWSLGELGEAPRFEWSKLWQYLGPGLLMGGAAIGGGEWLLGPEVTAKYKGSLLWLATMSILGQIIYNIEISRYTLYTGEPIFTGKFRTQPGPRFWVWLYLLLDIGTAFPYLAASAAVPALLVWLGGPIPTEELMMANANTLRILSLVIFVAALLPMIFGGKIYNSLKAVMTFKIVTVMGFLLVLSLFFSHASTWVEIFSGFFKFGNIPTGNQNEVVNIFHSLWNGQFPTLGIAAFGTLSSLVAISGQGGLSNTPISNYTRDQGWGMGAHVGAIPSLVGGNDLTLSHEGTVFLPDERSLSRWRAWVRHVVRDQLLVWGPACFFGLALPSMLSIEFLPEGIDLSKQKWLGPVATSDGVGRAVAAAVGPAVGSAFKFLTLFCGFLVLAPSMASTIDGFVRRWVDVFWTSSKRLREVDSSKIRLLYFAVLGVYAVVSLSMLAWISEPSKLLKIAGLAYNFALGFSCWHVLYINTRLLPEPLRPGAFSRVGLIVVGIYFWIVGILGAISTISGWK